MVAHLEQLKLKLNDPNTSPHDKPILRASCYMLKEIMGTVTRDVRRRLRESKEY